MSQQEQQLDPRHSVVLTFHTSPHSSTIDDESVFLAVKAVDGDAILLNACEQSDDPRLAQLLWRVGEGRMQGLLVVVMPGSVDAERVSQLLTIPSDETLISLEQVNQSSHSFLSYPFHNALALADRQAHKGGAALVVAPRPRRPNLVPAKFKFTIVPPAFATSELFHTFLAFRKFAFLPKAITALDHYLDPSPLLEDGDNCEIRPLEIYSDWFREEFKTKDTACAVLEILKKVLAGDGDNRPVFLPRDWQVAIGTLRMARCIATWTLEGQPFECSVLLGDTANIRSLVGLAGGSLVRVFHFSPPVPFDFCNEEIVRKSAESGQSDELFLVVDVKDGMLKYTAVSKNNRETSRYARFTALSNEDHIILQLHIRDGFVEAYAGGELALWHDGFRWRVRPFQALKRVVESHFKRAHVPDLLLNAVAELMDRKQGSTIVLLTDNDRREFDLYAGTLLRRNVSDHDERGHYGVDMADLPVGALTSILHLDGVHAINHKAVITHLAREIKIPSESVRPGDPGAWGVGASTARALSKKLPNSVVIRVSSSGYVKLFRDGEDYFPPTAA